MAPIGKIPQPRKKFICKHCKIPVIGKLNTRAKLGYEHGKHCPRRNKV